MPPGTGTALNVATVVLGAGIGTAVGNRLPVRTREVVTDALGLVTLLVAGLNAVDVASPALVEAVGRGAPVLVVLGALILGGVAGSLLHLEQRLERLGEGLRRRLSPRGESPFVEGFVAASLLFCVGPLAILGSLSDGLGRGIDQLALKSVLDGFASIAFAASFGWGVAAAAIPVLLVQGSITALGAVLGDVVPAAHLAAVTATGGLLLVGVALRLLRVRDVPVADLLPALLVAPLLVEVVVLVR